MSKPRLAIVGAGAWGTALAQALAKSADGSDFPVWLWARDADLVDAINRDHVNPRYLSGQPLAPAVIATADLAACATAPVVLMVTPAQAMGAVLQGMGAFSGDLVLCSKGIEAGTGRLMHEVAASHLPAAQLAVLSGPNFAHEVAAGLPAALALACAGGDAQWQRLAPLLARPALRPYYSADVIGAQVGGAVKNVLAIACGVVDGLGLGQNARAALIARGFAEMQRFGLALGALPETIAGLSGLGDLVLTCSSPASRNFALGRSLAEGADAARLLACHHGVAEGAHTAPVLARMAAQRGVAMPLVEAVVALLEGGVPAADVVTRLLARPLRAEQALG